MFSHERLDCYQCALKFAALSYHVIAQVPRGNADLQDQLKRATTSILLNIAEGAGKATTKEQARFYAIARGSTLECAAVLDVLRLQGIVQPEIVARAKETLMRVAAMLSRMARLE